ncbi:8.6 kDa transglutaminase substrate isoform X10 [Dermacentor silvarum]|uniref:8.6 kDa transglutaminase substrate isoform X10 n=1 Tax=Dermacentor silvarum TaxID=543639 RepID=UPI002100EC0D|nr:8.6 kDa transglutaminase substrate isoform X10 [Dermacentor silvarum]
MNATLVALLVITVAIVSVSATSPQNCASVTCNPHICRRVECGCGRYSDECGCCDLCYKCPGDPCNSWFLDRCTEGHRCILQEPSEHFDYGGQGRCTPEDNTHTSHNS